jgi:ABC-type polysaccharide/polyol phosphate export permease
MPIETARAGRLRHVMTTDRTTFETGSGETRTDGPGDAELARPEPVRVISARGRLASPGDFLAEWRADLVQSPRLAWRLFLRGLIQQYRHSVLGVLLAFAPVILTALVIAFGRRAQLISSDMGGVNAAFFGAFGVLLAQAFVEGINAAQRLFSGSQVLLKRQNVPLEAPLLAILIDLAFRDLVRLVVIGILMGIFHVGPSPWFPLSVWAIMGVSLLGAAIGLFTAPFAGLTSDLAVFSRALTVIVITTTPVFVSLSPESVLGKVQAANPLSWIFDGVRAAAYGAPGSLAMAAIGPAAAIAVFVVGWFACRVARPHVVERMIGGG